MLLNLKVYRFANIISSYRFKKITYYTVKFEDEEVPLFLQFLNKHKGEQYAENLAIIRAWLQKLGEEIGADERYFRNEAARGGDARALPPPAKYINVDCSLRLYCMRVNARVVILFNGGDKTAQTAQDCENVRPHFLLANKLTQAIDQAIKDREIRFKDNDDLILDEGTTLAI
ncbi:MAG TPA: hypothetical protein PKE06_02330 [Flavilitoribacter sp.]|nr:hypothetical protein [Flavilitoribacter sp.]HMQ88507.1 hypothetical protein [Flavilitoribacter sp.]